MSAPSANGVHNNGRIDLSEFLDRQVIPRLSPESIFTHESHQFQRSGDKLRGGCPWHESKSGTAFYIDVPTLRWRCPACDIGGGPLQYRWRLAGNSTPSPRGRDFIEAVRDLAQLAGVAFPEADLTEAEKELARHRETRRAVLESVVSLCEIVLWGEHGEPARTYLYSRGFTEDELRELRVGLYPKLDFLKAALTARGHTIEDIIDSCAIFERLVGYTAWPWHDDAGALLTIYGKWPDKKPPGGKPKTMALPNPKDGGKVWEQTKHSPLYFDRAVKAGQRDLVLVEGPTDAALPMLRGDPRMIACVAAELSAEQVKTLKRRGVQSVIIALDPDSGGVGGVQSCTRQLQEAGIRPFVAPQFPNGLDSDEFFLRVGIDGWKAHIGKAIHAYRHHAETLIGDHGERRPGDDLWLDDLIAKAVKFAEDQAAGSDSDMLLYFWPEIAKAVGATPEALASRANLRHSPAVCDDHGWTKPIPFDAGYDLPPFPTRLLPAVLREWVEAESEAKQTPLDLAASLALSICGAALATKVRVVVRDGWTEPTNLFTVVALLPGERKSAVFADAIVPVGLFEQEEQERMALVIAEAASEHRMMEAQLKAAEQKAAKAEAPEERQQLRHEAKKLAKELAAHVVPEPPQMFCDDETPESLCRLIAKQGGRMLQASPEGTAFEIVKGRYSETPNFDVYLKGHAGDPLRVGRVSRDRDTVDCPALSLALAVQPDVIQGLAEKAVLRGRGFLARPLYGLPVSRVGNRTIAPRPVAVATATAYRETVLRLWRLPGAVDDHGKPAPYWLHFSAAADQRMRDFEAWLEPQMAEGEDLSLLAGWAQKLAGAAARIAGILHVAEAVTEGRPWQAPIDERIVSNAVALARDYFLPHAQAAFAAMGADAKAANARHVWTSIANRCAHSADSAHGGPSVTRRDIHNWNRRRFPNVEELDQVLALLVDRYYLRPVGGAGQPGRGHSSPVYQVNPIALAAFVNTPPRPHCAQRAHLEPETASNAHSAHSADAPPRSDGEGGGGYCAPGYEDVQNPFDDEEGVNP